jgi:hypothetical protein
MVLLPPAPHTKTLVFKEEIKEGVGGKFFAKKL